MSNSVRQLEFVDVPPPYKDSKLAVHVPVPREVENLTLIDGKTFLATRLAGDTTNPSRPYQAARYLLAKEKVHRPGETGRPASTVWAN